MEVPISITPSSSEINQPPAATHTGTGRSLLGKIYSGASTVFQWTTGWNSQDVRANRGRQLTEIDVKLFINYLKKNPEDDNFNFLATLISGPAEISDTTILVNELKSRRYLDQQKPIFIPLVLGGGWFEMRHIVAIVIDPANKCIEYFDPQGVKSVNKKLLGGSTVDNFIKNLTKELKLDERGYSEVQGEKNTQYERIENTLIHQWNIHDCGAYVCYYAQARFNERKEASEVMNTPIERHRIIAIRDQMAKIRI